MRARCRDPTRTVNAARSEGANPPSRVIHVGARGEVATLNIPSTRTCNIQRRGGQLPTNRAGPGCTDVAARPTRAIYGFQTVPSSYTLPVHVHGFGEQVLGYQPYTSP